jgi:hypothetical protein
VERRLLSVRTLGAIVALVIATVADAGDAAETSADSYGTSTPEAVEEFLALADDYFQREPYSDERFFALVREHVWSVYADGVTVKADLLAYIETATGAGLFYAAAGLLAFRDVDTAQTVARRAKDSSMVEADRWVLLYALPHIMAIGDVWPHDGTLDEAEEYMEHFDGLIMDMSRHGLGTAHAHRLVEYDSIPDSERHPEHGLALWHMSAYLIGTLDLRDAPLLQRFVDPDYGVVFINIVNAMSLATGIDFFEPLRQHDYDEGRYDRERALAQHINTWWDDYLERYPDGAWQASAMESIRSAGYILPDAENGNDLIAQLSSALSDDNLVIRFTAARLLNDVCNTRFDLERIFLTSKYAITPFYSIGADEVDQQRLAEYWEQLGTCPHSPNYALERPDDN